MQIPVIFDTDVAVSGTRSGAVAAALAVQAAGRRVVAIVVERLHGLSGLGTLGLIASYYLGNRIGFTAQIDAELAKYSGELDKQAKGRWNPEDKSSWLMKTLLDAEGAAWLNSFAFGVKMKGYAGCISLRAVAETEHAGARASRDIAGSRRGCLTVVS